MEWKREIKILGWIAGIFLFAFFMPLQGERFGEALVAMFDLTQWYAREHVILCLLPAFFIAGVIAVFVSQGAIMKYFGARANKWLAYSVASVSGTILAVCSCTILPLFSSIHKRGAGLGPAIAFLYSGPAINILAIILTARILGFEMGIARIIGAIVFAIVIGSVMSLIYRKEEKAKAQEQMNFPDMPEKRPAWQSAFHFFTLVLILVSANKSKGFCFHDCLVFNYKFPKIIPEMVAIITTSMVYMRVFWVPITSRITSIFGRESEGPASNNARAGPFPIPALINP